MSTNKNATLRYQTLDRCFRNPGKKYFLDDLLEECNKLLYEFNGEQSMVARRQLFNDIKFMESGAGWSVPLKRYREGKKVYYRYLDLQFSINNQPLNETDINNLQSAIQILNKLEGIPQLQVVEQLLGKLKVGSTVEEFNPIVSFDENAYLKGMAFFGPFFNAITYQKVLRVTYQDFRVNEPYHITFHPHHLKQYNNRWFVFGYNPERSEYPWNLALDRVAAVEELSGIAFVPSTIEWAEYFEDLIGVSKQPGAAPIKIQLWVSPITAPYIVTKPLHGSQRKINSAADGLVLELELIPNYEFYQRILSFGGAIKILSPEDVVDRVVKSLVEALSHYTQKE